MRWIWVSFWGVAGVAMLVSSFWVGWFDVDFTWFKINVGWFAVTYSALLIVRNLKVQTELRMTPRELHDYGDLLSTLTPNILDLAEQEKRPKEIAEQLEREHKIPQLVSLKYMVALSKYIKRGQEEDFRSKGCEEIEKEESDGTSQESHEQSQ